MWQNNLILSKGNDLDSSFSGQCHRIMHIEFFCVSCYLHFQTTFVFPGVCSLPSPAQVANNRLHGFGTILLGTSFSLLSDK